MRILSVGAALLFLVVGCHHNSGSATDMGSGDDLAAGGGGDLAGQGQSCANGQPCPGGQQCDNGTCACPPYQAFCNGQCIPVANDGSNCGGCGVQCTRPLASSRGKCQTSSL